MTPKTIARLRRRLRASGRNALEIARLGRLAEPYGAPYDVVDQGEHHRLRRYVTSASDNAPAALLVPPLMVTSEVYDVAADVSAVAALGQAGVQPFVLDFGAPEQIEGGMKRTLDDHVKAVVSAINRVRELTSRDVHVCGYSQGGMFAYQAAAYLRSEGVRSVVTFGSPVDIHRNVPAMRSDVAASLVRYLEPGVTSIIDQIEGLPGFLTSTAFKMVSPRKELEQRIDFVRLLHDRKALERREARRRFLGGEGFVAWPGPAFRAFVDQFIVHNRMVSGGFVIDGRTVTLADITCPILSFVGATDEIARPASVRAITEAAPDAEISFVSVHAGHFGIVVGSRAMQTTWPTVSSWIHWRDGRGPEPEAIRKAREEAASQRRPEAPEDDDTDELPIGDVDVEIELLFDTARDTIKSAWRTLGDVAASAYDALDGVRYQEPRLRRLAELSPGDRISASLALAEAAKSTPDDTFFLYRGRAFRYRDADERVTNVVKGLFASGVRPGERVGVVMGSRPSFLSMVTAIGRLGAVAVVAPPDAGGPALFRAFDAASVNHVVCDPEKGPAVRNALGRDVLVLGGGGGKRALPEGLVDMEAINPDAVVLPHDLELDPGRARNLALILLRPSPSGELRSAHITNHRWALSALGAAAACTLKPGDTVYSAIPLHHPTGILVSVGAALTGGVRLALADGFSPHTFAADVRRCGATVVFYAGEMLRALLFEEPSRGDRTLPVRLFAGSGLRPALAARLHERFGIGSIEFYAATTQKVILANASGEKPGALGRMLPGSDPIAIVQVDLDSREPRRDDRGRLLLSPRGDIGLLASRLGDDDAPPSTQALVEGAFAPGDRWVLTGDVVREDDQGDVWFVDSLSAFVATPQGHVSPREIEDALYTFPSVELAVAFTEQGRLVAAFSSREPITPTRLTDAIARLPAHARPDTIAHVDALPVTDGFRPRKAPLDSLSTRRTYHLDESRQAYT